MPKGRTIAAAAAIGGLVLAAGCGSSSSSGGAASATLAKAAKATSAAAFGGMSGLIAAARKEGQLNVIRLPANWANYGTIMRDFSKKYGIKITDANVLAGQQNVGMALSLVMIVIIAVVMTGYALLQRRAARWLR